jgi:hypothetical protein
MKHLRLLLLILPLFAMQQAFAQDPKCKILLALLEDTAAARHFLLTEYPGVPLVFIDTANYFTECSFKDIYQRPVSLVHDRVHLNDHGNPYLIVTKFKQLHNNDTLAVIQKNTGTAARLICKRSRDQVISVKVEFKFF